MGDCESVIPELKGEENVIAAAKHIFKALGSNNLTVDERKILAALGTQLSTMTAFKETKDDGTSEIKDRLHAVEKEIMRWEEDQSTTWDSVPEEASEYLRAAGEAQKLTERLESLCLNKDDDEYMLLQRAHNIRKKAMERLEVEFRHMLVENRQPFERDNMSFRSSEEYVMDKISIISFGDESVDSLQKERDCLSRASQEYMIDLIHPDVIPDLRRITNLMFKSNYDQQCYQAYTSVRKDALDECLFILEMGKLSIEDVLRMECG